MEYRIRALTYHAGVKQWPANCLRAFLTFADDLGILLVGAGEAPWYQPSSRNIAEPFFRSRVPQISNPSVLKRKTKWPSGPPSFVKHQLRQANQRHQHLFDRIPHLEDLQASRLLLLSCASPRCIYLLRVYPPHITAEFANNHDFAVAAVSAATSSKSTSSQPPL